MPAILAGSTVLVTGASGFVAAHVADQLIERGHHVVGTVRSEAKGKYLESLFAKRHSGSGKFTFVVVEDVEQDSAFDESITKYKVDGIAHVASPFHFKVSDPFKDLINPALNGTRRLLESAERCGGSHIKRICITSSFAAMVNPPMPGQVFTEKDWNSHSPEQVEKLGKDVSPLDAYRASKTLAEKAAWEFQEGHKPRFDIATINPPYILGPIIHQVESPDKLNTSVANFYGYLSGSKTEKDLENGGPGGCFINVIDVARAHVESLLRSQGADRFAVSARAFCWQEVADQVRESYPERKKTPVGKPGSGAAISAKAFTIDSSRARSILFDDKDFISLKDTVQQMADSIFQYERTVWRV